MKNKTEEGQNTTGEKPVEVLTGLLPGDTAVRRRRNRLTSLARTLGVTGIFSIAYGNLNSSIYYALGVTAIYALGATPLVFMLAAILFMFTAASYAEGTAAIPEAGGSSSFARKGFNELISFIAGWCLLLGYIVTISIAAFAAIGYLGYLDIFSFLRESPWNVVGTGILLFILMIVNIVGTRSSVAISKFFAFMDIVTQIFLVAIALFLFLNVPELISRIHWGVAPTWNQLVSSLFIVMISFTGIETISNLAEETKDPGTTIPRSIWLSMGTAVVMFLLVSSVALSAMPVEYRIEGYIYKVPSTGVDIEPGKSYDRTSKLVHLKEIDETTVGQPVEGAIIKVTEAVNNPKQQPRTWRVRTDEKGKFLINRITYGLNVFKIYKKGYNVIEFSFDTSKPSIVSNNGKWTTDLIERWKNDPVAGIADAIAQKLPNLQDPLKIWVSLLPFIVLSLAANAGILAVSRLIFSMGMYNQVPPILAKVGKARTPYIAIIVFTIVAFLIVLPADMEKLAQVYAFSALISYTIAHASIIAMRIKFPSMERPFRIPFNITIGKKKIPMTAIIGGFVCFAIWVMVAYQREYGRNVGTLFLMIGLLIFWLFRRHQGLSLTETKRIKKEIK